MFTNSNLCHCYQTAKKHCGGVQRPREKSQRWAHGRADEKGRAWSRARLNAGDNQRADRQYSLNLQLAEYSGKPTVNIFCEAEAQSPSLQTNRTDLLWKPNLNIASLPTKEQSTLSWTKVFYETRPTYQYQSKCIEMKPSLNIGSLPSNGRAPLVFWIQTILVWKQIWILQAYQPAENDLICGECARLSALHIYMGQLVVVSEFRSVNITVCTWEAVWEDLDFDFYSSCDFPTFPDGHSDL